MTAVVPRPPLAVQNEPGDIASLLRLAIEKNIGVEALERLTALHERISDRQAARAFADALARFQAACPAIPKSQTAKIATRSGGGYSYTYANLDDIVRVAKPLLAAEGLAYGWDSETASGQLTCICTLRHVEGHREASRFTLPVENASAMSDQQKHGAALTYARRQSLVQVLGLTTTDLDNDAGDSNPEPVSEAQSQQLDELIDDAGVNRKRFLAWLRVESVSEVLARDFDAAVDALNKKRKEKSA